MTVASAIPLISHPNSMMKRMSRRMLTPALKIKKNRGHLESPCPDYVTT